MFGVAIYTPNWAVTIVTLCLETTISFHFWSILLQGQIKRVRYTSECTEYWRMTSFGLFTTIQSGMNVKVSNHQGLTLPSEWAHQDNSNYCLATILRSQFSWLAKTLAEFYIHHSSWVLGSQSCSKWNPHMYLKLSWHPYFCWLARTISKLMPGIKLTLFKTALQSMINDRLKSFAKVLARP